MVSVYTTDRKVFILFRWGLLFVRQRFLNRLGPINPNTILLFHISIGYFRSILFFRNWLIICLQTLWFFQCVDPRSLYIISLKSIFDIFYFFWCFLFWGSPFLFISVVFHLEPTEKLFVLFITVLWIFSVPLIRSNILVLKLRWRLGRNFTNKTYFLRFVKTEIFFLDWVFLSIFNIFLRKLKIRSF